MIEKFSSIQIARISIVFSFPSFGMEVKCKTPNADLYASLTLKKQKLPGMLNASCSSACETTTDLLPDLLALVRGRVWQLCLLLHASTVLQVFESALKMRRVWTAKLFYSWKDYTKTLMLIKSMAE